MTTATTDLAAGSTTSTAAPTNSTADQLRLFVERIERLEEEKKGMADDIKDVYLEAKAMGFDTKGMKSVVQLRKMEKDARDEMDAIVETYRNALGML